MATSYLPQRTTTPQAPPVPQVPAPAVPGGTASLPVLQAQLADLNAQLAGLLARQDGLNRQVEHMRQSNPARPQVVQQLAEVGVQIADVQGSAAKLRAQIAHQLNVPENQIGQSGQIQPPPAFNFRRGPDPDAVVVMSFILAIAVLAPLSIAFARRIFRGAPKVAPSARSDETAQRLERMEHAVDAIAIEVERIAEGQRFVTKILAERPTGASYGAGESAQPTRALGAGPIEPIKASERVGVKQSITPN